MLDWNTMHNIKPSKILFKPTVFITIHFMQAYEYIEWEKSLANVLTLWIFCPFGLCSRDITVFEHESGQYLWGLTVWSPGLKILGARINRSSKPEYWRDRSVSGWVRVLRPEASSCRCQQAPLWRTVRLFWFESWGCVWKRMKEQEW